MYNHMFENTRSTAEDVDFRLFNAKIPQEQQTSLARSFLKRPADDPRIKKNRMAPVSSLYLKKTSLL